MPEARMGHSAVLSGDALIIFGGRISPAQPLNDLWSLHLPTCTWRRIQCRGSPPPPRFRHTAVAFTNRLKVCLLIITTSGLRHCQGVGKQLWHLLVVHRRALYCYQVCVEPPSQILPPSFCPPSIGSCACKVLVHREGILSASRHC